LIWQCSCGEVFKETGNREGYGQLMKHIWDAKQDEPDAEHKAVGLIDEETGEVLVQGQNIKKAIKEGYVKPKALDKTPKSSGRKTSPIRGESKFLKVDLDPELWVLYELARAKFPESYGETTFEEWITDCILAFYQEHPELGFDVLFRNRPEVQQFISEGGEQQ